MARVFLYVRTVRYLRPAQLFWQLYRRLRPVVRVAPVEFTGAAGLGPHTAWCRVPQPAAAVFEFLHQRAAADPVALDWHPADKPRLWRYNLHYFDYLQWDAIPDEWKAAYIESWIKANPQGTVDGWEPYTASLRIVNWIKYFAGLQTPVPVHWQASLLNQANWLLHNLEHHILANHFLKNAKALLFAGAWFEGAAADQMLQAGQRYLQREWREQVLADGGHYERSPMYHCIVTEDLLDVLNITGAARCGWTGAQLAELRDVCERLLEFVASTLNGADAIPLFNDAAYDIAPTPAALFYYGEAVCGYRYAGPGAEPRVADLPDSGYFGYRLGGDSLLIDCGEVGPDYQPGHAHCDTLSYELCIAGHRIIADGGVHGYDDDPTRAFLRATAAHNTVQLNGVEQSEIWGTFRVGRRARPLAPLLTTLPAGRLEFAGAHDGYLRTPQRAVHRRLVEIDVAGRWAFSDTVEGQGDAQIRSFINFAPGVALAAQGPGRWNIMLNNVRVAELRLASPAETELSDAYVATGFGRRHPTERLAFRQAGQLPLRIDYEIIRRGPD